MAIHLHVAEERSVRSVLLPRVWIFMAKGALLAKFRHISDM